MFTAQMHLPAGRKDTFHFQRIYSFTLRLVIAFQVLQCLEAERAVIKDATRTHCEEHGQVTIIYPGISLVIVPDECVWKLGVKAPNGRLTMQHNKGTGASEESVIRLTASDVKGCGFLYIVKAEYI